MLKFLDKTGLDTLWAKIKSTFQTLGNLVTAWGSAPSDTKYPSEKLVKTALDAKVPGKALSVSVPASSTRYVKMVVPSGYHHYLVFFNASLAYLHAEWLFRSYGEGGTNRTVVNYIGALVAARKWYVAGASGNTFYIEFVNNTTGSQVVNFKVCALDISALPTLTVESEVPSGYVEQPVVGTVASQLLTARKLAVSLSNTSTDTTFNGSANVTNIKVGGTLGVANGGTGKSSVTNNNFLVGNGTGALVEKAPSEVRTLIGAGTSSLTIGPSSTQAAAGDHKHGTMHSSFTRTVPDQSSDTTWATNLGLENNGFWLKSLRMQNNAPNWLVNNFGAGIAFGGADTKGVISLAYDNSAQVRFVGGNGQSPNWYWTLKGSPGKTYTLPSDTCSLQAAFSIKKNGATITPSDGEANIGYMPVTGTLETATVQGAIQALRVNPGGKMGSVQLSASTVDSTSIPAAWYNYIWIPHRTGAAEADNQNFGTLILTPMTSTPEVYVIEGSALNTSSPTYRISTLQASLPTSGTASTTYAINVGGNAATATSATTATNYNTNSGTIKTTFESKLDIAPVGLSGPNDLLTLVKSLGTNNIRYRRWFCASSGESNNISNRPNSDESAFMLEAFAKRWISASDYQYELIYYRTNTSYPYIASIKQDTTSITWSNTSNAPSATTATTASNFDTSGGTIKSSLSAKVNIASDGVVATSNSHWDIIMQVATIASNGVHYKRWLCNSDGTSAFVDYRPNSDNAAFMLEAYAVKWNSYEDCKYKLLYWRSGKQMPYVAELIFNQAQGLFPQTITWYDTGAADTKVKATAKTDNANYKILATASASPTSGSATEAVYDTDITLNPSTNTISANITGDAQSVRGLYITKTIVNDPNAIIFF